MQKPSILLIHNTYLQRGGEDSVVQQELDHLQKENYRAYTLFFNNTGSKIRNALSYPFELFFNVAAFVKVFRLVKKERIDIVHVHNFYYKASPAVFWAAKAAGAKTIFTLHNYRLFCLNGLFFYKNQTCMLCHETQHFRPGITRRCFKHSALFSGALAMATLFHRRINTWHTKVDRFVVINQLQQQLLLQTGITSRQIFYKPNFLSNSQITPVVDPDARERFYLYAGRLSEEKGIRFLIRSFKTNGRKLRVVGDGPLANWVQSQADGTISYTAAVPRNQLLQLYATCAAFVFPSIWPEGQPMTVIEAQSTGTVVIAASSINMDQMIQDRKTGLLYNPLQEDDLNRVIHIFESLSVAEKKVLSASAHQHFLRSYTEQQHIDALHTLYHFEPSSNTNKNDE